MFKDKKKLFIIIAAVLVLVIIAVLALVLLKNDNKNTQAGNSENSNNDVVIPDAPSENTESLIQDLEKIEVLALNNDTIELPETVAVNDGDKVAVWVYSTPKFLGYFDVVVVNGAKLIKGLEEAMKKLKIDSGEHNIAIVTEDGESVGFIDVYVDENKLFEDEKAAEVAKYTTKEVTEEIEVKYKTVTKKDANLKSGSKEVTQQGVTGLNKITYKITYDEDGNEISKEKVSEKIVKKAVDEIITVGTADFNINTSKITNEFVGFMCSESQTIIYDGQKGCNDSVELPSFKAIAIDGGVNKVVTLNEAAISPITVTRSGNLYIGKYNGATHYFDPRGGGGNPDGEPLTMELCKKYNLSCGAW